MNIPLILNVQQEQGETGLINLEIKQEIWGNLLREEQGLRNSLFVQWAMFLQFN